MLAYRSDEVCLSNHTFYQRSGRHNFLLENGTSGSEKEV
jgi:hypothetical protein